MRMEVIFKAITEAVNRLWKFAFAVVLCLLFFWIYANPNSVLVSFFISPD